MIDDAQLEQAAPMGETVIQPTGHAPVPRISVIVPVWNRPADIERCIRSLQKQTLPQSDYEIIIVDNGSTDSTPAVARKSGVHVLVEPRPSSYAARNLGLSAARGDYVAFTDSDCTVDENWLAKGLEALDRHPDNAVVAGPIELFSENMPTSSSVCEAYERIFAFRQERNVARGAACTANWFCRTAVVRQAGGFRSDLKSGGDFDLTRRLQAAGYPVVYAPDALVFHPARATVSELCSKARRVIGGRMMMRRNRRNPLHWWAGLTIDTLRRFQTLFTERCPLVMRARLSILLVTLWLAACWEVLLITLGGEPRRA
ncbi:glycosyltransferase [Novosphingobium pentaromativorans]|uniref:Dolichyl-phosphate mannose synthase related protein n=1 Tax=Novosphingobium pentaromativorans US6-1 TaxID=1088721 RepID=G6EKK7_9SPHN|nr:glycosyltransferase [Novosphingobium pentaromativorans]EHJ58163.1 dolichyl-phosphate mannose synthase related protein [Novosphingobium pentaromativorans US6-1]